jgi:hypothetical protein
MNRKKETIMSPLGLNSFDKGFFGKSLSYPHSAPAQKAEKAVKMAMTSEDDFIKHFYDLAKKAISKTNEFTDSFTKEGTKV